MIQEPPKPKDSGTWKENLLPSLNRNFCMSVCLMYGRRTENYTLSPAFSHF